MVDCQVTDWVLYGISRVNVRDLVIPITSSNNIKQVEQSYICTNNREWALTWYTRRERFMPFLRALSVNWQHTNSGGIWTFIFCAVNCYANSTSPLIICKVNFWLQQFIDNICLEMDRLDAFKLGIPIFFTPILICTSLCNLWYPKEDLFNKLSLTLIILIAIQEILSVEKNNYVCILMLTAFQSGTQRYWLFLCCPLILSLLVVKKYMNN